MTTGNELVDKIGEIAITGNIIPQMWYETLKKDDGKPYFQAIVILADIVYWYKPVEVRDEKTGRVVGYKKKFSADLLQRTYDSIAEQFGISKNETVNAVKFLEKKGVIYRELRTVQCGDIRCGNVLFLGINPEKLQELTFKKSYTYLSAVGRGGVSADREVPTRNGETYTENTTEITTEISCNISDINITCEKEKNIKKKEEENLEQEFEEVWKIYPRKEDKKKAFLAYKTARKKASFDEIKKGVETYSNHIRVSNTDKRYIKLGATYFNGECWANNYEQSEPKEELIKGKYTRAQVEEFAKQLNISYEKALKCCGGE